MPEPNKAQRREAQRFKHRYGPKVHGKRLGLLYAQAVLKRWEEIKRKQRKGKV